MADATLETNERQGATRVGVQTQLSDLAPAQICLLLSLRARRETDRQRTAEFALEDPFLSEITATMLSSEERALLSLFSDVELSLSDDISKLPWAAVGVESRQLLDSATASIRGIIEKLPAVIQGKLHVGSTQALEEREMPKAQSMTVSELVARIIAEMDGVPVETITPEYVQAYKSTVIERMEKYKRDNPGKCLP